MLIWKRFAPVGCWVTVLCAASVVLAAGPQQQPGPTADEASVQRAVLDQYCITCHNARTRTAGLTLDTMDLSNVGANAEIWEKVIRKLRAKAMPPPGRPRPDQGAAGGLVSWLERNLDEAAAASLNPGRTEAVHRLNRAEYQNAVRDLLALDIDVSDWLPADDAGKDGFDNTAGVLSVSPALFDRYLSAARRLSWLAVGRPPVAPTVETYRNARDLGQDDRLSEDLPFGSQGGLAVRHHFPVDGEYVVKVALQRNYVEYPRGIEYAHQLDVRLDGIRLERFDIGGDAGSSQGKAAPLSYAGNIYGDPEWERWALHIDDDITVRFSTTAGPHVLGLSFVRQHVVGEDIPQPLQTAIAFVVNETPHAHPGVDSITIAGPYASSGVAQTPSRDQIFICQPTRTAEAEPCARQILSKLARRAYRRPATEADVDTLLSFFRTGRDSGGFDGGIQLAIERLLADPDFLFRIEGEPLDTSPGEAYRLGGLTLAWRLSFFLWSSIPDDELLDVAIDGALRDPVVLEQQVRRMLADPRAKALVDNFAGQWLVLRNIRQAFPDPVAYPEFDESLRVALARESELFIEGQLREDRSVVDLLAADYTYVNERLARHYGIPDVYGSRFRRVDFDASDQRGGLLGQGGIHLVTSYPDRTSPVLRGKWLLENILGTPPPPPPPNVPALPGRRESGREVSVRERLEQHRTNPVCAGCHEPMDPLGFALEHFDPIGHWRDTDGGAAIDASGALPDGTTFEGLAGLRTELLKAPEQFVATVTEKLLTYALGRNLEYYDMPTVRAITRASAEQNYRWSSIILGIIESVPFQMRSVFDPDSALGTDVAASR